MKRSATVAALLSAAGCLASPVMAQQPGAYLRLSAGAAHLESPGARFRTDPVAQPSAALGYAFGGGHSFELRAGYLKTEATESVPQGVLVDAPYTIGVRAVPLGAAYQYWLPSPAERAYPVLSLGVVWAAVRDTWKSDTPEESRSTSAYGLDASLGLVTRLTGGVSVVARGGYRSVGSAGDRPARAFGLSGPYVDAGLQLGW